MVLTLMIILLWLPMKILFHLKVVNKKNIPKKGRVVLCCNHYSNLDVILIQLNTPRRLFYLAKKELMKNKLVSWFLKKLGAFPVERGVGDISATKFVLSKLKEERALCLFPEGTRNKTNTDDLQALKSGAIVFASKTNSPIVPMMLLKRPKIFRRNVLVVGEPLQLDFENPQKSTKEEIENATILLADSMKKLQKDNIPKFYKKDQKR